MIEILQELDAQMLLAVNGLHTPLADRFMMAFTNRWVWVPLYVALAWYLVRRQGWRNGFFCILAIGIAVTIADQTCATLIRPMVERLRPSNEANPLSAAVHIVDGYRGGSYGFPSCHAANTFALATFFTLLCTRTPLAPMLITWALANCYTRMHLGVHYPGDLIVGASIGILASLLCYFLLRNITRTRRLAGREHTLPPGIVMAVLVAGILIYSFL